MAGHHQPPLRVAQLTDAHLLADPGAQHKGRQTDETLRRVLASLAEVTPPPDLVLLTGDLVHDESMAGYQRLSRLMAPWEGRVYALAGNHDAPEPLARVLPGVPRGAPVCVDRGVWRVILLDSRLPGATQGRMGEGQLQALAALLAGPGPDHVLLALHHHPVAVGTGWLDTLGVEDADALWRVLNASAKVRAVVCGHVHQAHALQRQATAVFTTPATCYQFQEGAATVTVADDPPGYRILDLSSDGAVDSRVVWVSA